MPARSLPALVARLARKYLLQAIAPKRRGLRVRLELVPLEERTMPALLHHGESWSDAYTDAAGNYHDPTVAAFNSGLGDIVVDGGNGAVTAVGAAGSGATYGLDVSSYVAGGGNVTWHGEAAALSISAPGSIHDIAIAGNANLIADQDIGAVSANDVHVFARGDIGAVTAGGEDVLVEAGGNLASLTAAHNIDEVSAYGNLGSVHAGGSIRAVVAGTLTGSVVATTIETVTATDDILGEITVGGDITGVQAGRDLAGTVAAGGAIGRVDVGHRLTGNVHAAGSIDEVDVGLAGPSNPDSPSLLSGSVTAGTLGGVRVRDDLTGSIAATTGGIAGVVADHDLNGTVTSAGDIIGLTAGHDLGGTVTATGFIDVVNAGSVSGHLRAGTDLIWVTATGDITGELSAGGLIWAVRANGSIGGTISAGTSVGDTVSLQGGVSAGEDFTANLTAGTDVREIDAGGDLGGTIHAGNDVARLHAIGALNASVSAARDIVNVDGGSITGTFQAGRDIYDARTPGDVAGASFDAGGGIGEVWADGSLTGTIHAGANVGYLGDPAPDLMAAWAPGDWGGVHAGGSVNATVTAGQGITSIDAGQSVSGRVLAMGDVVEVSAATGDVAAMVSAERDLGSVIAGRSVTGGVGARGSVALVEALGGVVSGNVTAGTDIGTVEAFGPSGSSGAGSPPSVPTVDGSFTGTDEEWQRPDRPALHTGGDISGQIHAGGSVDWVEAHGEVSGGVWAGQNAAVWAAGDITGVVEATSGAVNVATWGNQTSSVTGGAGVSAWAYGTISGEMISAEGSVDFGSWSDVTGSVQAKTAISGFAWGSIGTLSGGEPESSEAPPTNSFHAEGNVELTAGADIEAGTIESDEGDVSADARNSVAAQHASAGQNLSVRAQTGSVSGDFVAQTGQANLWAAEDVAGSVTAQTAAVVYAYNSVSAPVTVREGTADVWAVQDITGAVWAMWYARVEAGNDITGEVRVPGSGTADDPAGWTTAQLQAGGDVTGNVFANGDVNVQADGDVTGNVEALWGNVGVLALGDLTGDVTGGWDVRVQAGGEISGHVNAGASDSWANAVVLAGSDLTGSVWASGDVAVDVGGVLSSDVTAYGGSADIVSLGTISGDISAGAKADVRAWGMSGTVDAVDDVKVVSIGDVDGQITSTGGDVDLYAEGDVTAPVAGHGDVAVRSLGSVTGSVHAGEGESWGTATVSAVEDVSGAVDATWAVEVDAGGSVTGGLQADNGYIDVVARDGMSGSVDSGGWVQYVVYGHVEGDITAAAQITGTVFGDLEAHDQSTGASVTLWASGTISGQTEAETNADVTALGDIDGDVVAGGPESDGAANLQAGGSIAGNVTASQELTLWAGGSVSGNLTSSNASIYAFAKGNILGVVDAATWATVVTFADLFGPVTAGQDVVVVSEGQISSAITSREASASVWSFVGIQGIVTARTGVDLSTEGGLSANVFAGVESSQGTAYVRAKGQITGSVESGGTLRVETGSDLPGTLVSRYGDIAVLARGNVTGPIAAAGGVTVNAAGSITSAVTSAATPNLNPFRDLSTIRGQYAPPQVAVDAVSGAVGMYSVGEGQPQPREIKVLLYCADPNVAGIWHVSVDGAALTGFPNGIRAKDEAELLDRLDTLRPDTAEVKYTRVRICGLALAQQRAAEQKAYEQARADEMKRVQEAKAAAEEARKEALRQQAHDQAVRETQQKEAKRQLNLPPRMELRPDLTVPSVMPTQDPRVRKLLDGPQGVGGKIFVIEEGQIVIPPDNSYLSRATKKEFEAAVRTRYLELLDEQERQNPDYAINQLQKVLGFASMVPVIGIPFAALDTTISLSRGDVAGASLSALAMLPGIGTTAGGAKVAQRGLQAAKLAGKDSRVAERAAGLLKKVDEATAMGAAANQARLNLAAALETGYLKEKQIRDQLTDWYGLSSRQADDIIAEAKVAARQSPTPYNSAKSFFAKMKASPHGQWPAKLSSAVEQAGLDFEKLLAAKYGHKQIEKGFAYSIPTETAVTDSDLLAVSELRGAEHGLTVMEDGSQWLTRGEAAAVANYVPPQGTVKELVHTQPGQRNVIPSIEDLNDTRPMRIIARGDAATSTVSLSFSPEEMTRLHGYLDFDPLGPAAARIEGKKQFYTEMVTKLQNAHIKPPEEMVVEMDLLGMELPH